MKIAPEPVRLSHSGTAFMTLCLVLALMPLQGLAQTYRWTDESGKVHFSDQPPPDNATETEELEVKGPDRIGQGREVEAIHERTRRLLEAEEDKRRERQEEQARSERQKADQQQRCARARQRLKKISGPFVYIGDDGERYAVSEEKAKKDRRELRQWIEKNCS